MTYTYTPYAYVYTLAGHGWFEGVVVSFDLEKRWYVYMHV